ncbi:hypothetical protein KAU08_00185, partial [bacterium]|nr:hypothetical protein [bacterium]
GKHVRPGQFLNLDHPHVSLSLTTPPKIMLNTWNRRQARSTRTVSKPGPSSCLTQLDDATQNNAEYLIDAIQNNAEYLESSASTFDPDSI